MKNKRIFITLCAVAFLLSSCSNYNNVLRAEDYDYRYEAAKEYYAAGEFTHCYQILEDMILLLKATDKGEESLYMLAMCYFNLRYYDELTYEQIAEITGKKVGNLKTNYHFAVEKIRTYLNENI